MSSGFSTEQLSREPNKNQQADDYLREAKAQLATLVTENGKAQQQEFIIASAQVIVKLLKQLKGLQLGQNYHNHFQNEIDFLIHNICLIFGEKIAIRGRLAHLLCMDGTAKENLHARVWRQVSYELLNGNE
jgi:hypothetical protein